MYATQVEQPSRSVMRTSMYANDEVVGGVARYNDIPGRILTYWVAGTFGLLSPTYLHDSAGTANWNINRIEIDVARDGTRNAISSAARDIVHVRQVMKTSVSELARLFGVSRQAVHEWMKGGALSQRNAERLSALAQAADMLLQSGLEITPQMLRRKISGGLSLLESVRDSANVVGLAGKLVDTLARESQQRERLAARLAGRQRPVSDSIDFGAPNLKEDA